MSTDVHVDRDGAPDFRGSGEKIKSLERRLVHLRRQLASWDPSRGGDGFVRKEASALKYALAALRYHRAEMKGLPSVATALKELVRAVEGDAIPGVDPKLLGVAATHARVVLAEWDEERGDPTQ